MARAGVTLGTVLFGVFGAGSSEVTPDVLNPCPREEGARRGLCSVPKAV